MDTIIVLSDGSTYDSASDCDVLILTAAGQELVQGYGDAKVIEDEHVAARVTLSELLDLWNKTHGTEF